MLWDHASVPEELKRFPPAFLRSAFLRKSGLLSEPTEAEVAIKGEPVTIAVELILIPDSGPFHAC